jgi:mannose-P-dolichol utilization defect 1
MYSIPASLSCFLTCPLFSLYHPQSFGENLSLLIQNVILVFLSWQYSTSPVSVQEKGLVFLGYGAYVFVVVQVLPEDLRYLLMSSTWPVMLYARGSQVFETFQVKHTGQLSIVTTSMNLVGALIRIGTTMTETGDSVVLAGYLLSCALSLLMFVQYFMYLNNTNKQMAAKSAEKKQD